jgi:hypothetical protein
MRDAPQAHIPGKNAYCAKPVPRIKKLYDTVATKALMIAVQMTLVCVLKPRTVERIMIHTGIVKLEEYISILKTSLLFNEKYKAIATTIKVVYTAVL